MKVIFIANWHEISGWSEQACRHILSLDSTGVEVIPRKLNITGVRNPNVDPRILELASRNDDQNSDVVILNTLPSLYERAGSLKFVGYFMSETSNFRKAGWVNKINVMDRAIVPCWQSKLASENSGVKIQTDIVPIPIDLGKFNKEREPHAVRRNNPDAFIFYTIGEFTRRKNVETLLKAFHLEFHPTEAVELFIKTTPAGLDNPGQRISEMVDNVKRGLKLYRNINKYKKENIVCNYSVEEEINSIHQSCDSFVSVSHGEAWNLPCMDALLAGKVVIASRWGGHLDYLTDKNSYLVDGKEDACFGCLDTLPDMYVGNETYFYPSVESLRDCMRKAFLHHEVNLRKKQQAQKDLKKFSFEEVGLGYRKVLEKLC